jgi:hypothetical protein
MPMTKLVLLAIPLAACAAGGVHVDLDSAPHAMPQLSLHAIDATKRVTRVPIAPDMPNTERLANQIRHVFGSQAVTDIKLCIRPSGKTVSAELVGGSALPAFDQAVVRDALAWQFAAIPGPESLQSCQLVAITYRPHR